MNEEIENNDCLPGLEGHTFEVNVAQDNFPKRQKWWNNYTFPLVPQLEIRKANKHNTWDLSFHWLFFKIWTLDGFGFEIAFVIDNHWGIGFTVIVPYLRLVACIPCPTWLGIKIQQKLWRRPKVDY